MLKVEKISATTLPVYEELSRAQGNVFSSPEWLSIYGNSLDRFGIFDESGKIVGGFVIRVKSHVGLKVIKSPPFMPHNGLFVSIASTNPAAVNGFRKKIQEAMVHYFSSQRPAIISCSFPKEYIDYQPFIWAKYKVIPRYTYLLDLQLTEDQLWQNMAGERRNDLKKAGKDAVYFVLNDKPAIVQELIMNSFHRNKAGVNEKPVGKILQTMSSVGAAYSYTTYWQDQAVATAYCITDQQTSYYILGGYNENRRHKGAGALALWKSILHAREMGLKVFDFEGSMIPAVEHYFRGFGGQIVPFFTVNKAPFLVECGLKLIKRSNF